MTDTPDQPQSQHEHEGDRVSALSALIAWADRRERLPEDRADAVALAWRTGSRNVAELARLARVSRDTVYADLRSRGISPTQRADDAREQDDARNRPPGPTDGGSEPLKAESLSALAQLADAVLRPAWAEAPENPLARVAFSTRQILQTLADALDPPTDQGPGWTRGELLGALTDTAAETAHRTDAALAAEAEPGALATGAALRRRELLHLGTQAVAESAEVLVELPVGRSVRMSFGRDETGWTTLESEDPLITGDGIDGLDHLEVRRALAVLSRVATRHLDAAAFVERRRDRLPESAPPRVRVTPSHEDGA